MSPMPLLCVRRFWMLLAASTLAVCGQAPSNPTGQRPAGQTPGTPGGAKKPRASPGASMGAPQSKHYPILLIASGTEPFWSARIGVKGAERLERVSYPPIALEPGEILTEDSGTAWTYHAKDTGTNADVVVRLSREACSDGMSETKYSFRAVVT